MAELISEKQLTLPPSAEGGRRRIINYGQELSIDKLRGRWIFRQVLTNKNTGSRWVDVAHARNGRSRTVRVDQIKTVHRMKKGLVR